MFNTLNFPKLILFFTLYSFIGWLAEVSYSLFKKKILINRGFLHIPFCPIYGFSLTAIYIFTSPSLNILQLFIISIIIATSIEYITGLLMEEIFNYKWWDYSDEKFNLKGYICPKFSFYWGLSILIISKFVNPIILYIINNINNKIQITLSILLLLIFMIDFLLSSKYAFSGNNKHISILKE